MHLARQLFAQSMFAEAQGHRPAVPLSSLAGRCGGCPGVPGPPPARSRPLHSRPQASTLAGDATECLKAIGAEQSRHDPTWPIPTSCSTPRARPRPAPSSSASWTTPLARADDGELFLEYRQSEALAFDDGRLKSASFDTDQGFGLRAVAGEAAGYAHASELTDAAVQRAGETVKTVQAGYGGTMAAAPSNTNRQLYTPDNPLGALAFEAKVKLLSEIDAYVRARDPRVRQATVSLAGSWQAVQILRAGGERRADIRPLVRLNVSVVLEQDGRLETGSYGTGGRVGYDGLITPESWQAAADEALRQAEVNLGSVDAPAGEMPVLLGAGWPGILPARGGSATAWRATSTARRPRPSPGCWANRSPPPASR